MSKQLWLFDDYEERQPRGYKETYADYNSFVDKFKAKKTTDDCYTPEAVYDVVADYVRAHGGEGREFVRPFFPGGDYQSYDYPEGCVVVDNPPFSIYAKIVRWYLARGIHFFLFAPALTTIVQGADVTYIIASASVIYANGANVRTSFVTNLPAWSADRIVLDGDLKARLEAACKIKTNHCEQRSYDRHIMSSALFNKYSDCTLTIAKHECHTKRNLDVLREQGRSMFGGVILISTAAAERLQQAQQACTGVYGHTSPVCTLSIDEQAIINQLDKTK